MGRHRNLAFRRELQHGMAQQVGEAPERIACRLPTTQEQEARAMKSADKDGYRRLKLKVWREPREWITLKVNRPHPKAEHVRVRVRYIE